MSAGGARPRWDDANAKRSHANECNVSTRDAEFVLSFGVSQAVQPDPGELVIDLGHRIVMTPHVAKRLAVALHRLLAEYEARWEAPRAPAAPPETGA